MPGVAWRDVCEALVALAGLVAAAHSLFPGVDGGAVTSEIVFPNGQNTTTIDDPFACLYAASSDENNACPDMSS